MHTLSLHILLAFWKFQLKACMCWITLKRNYWGSWKLGWRTVGKRGRKNYILLGDFWKHSFLNSLFLMIKLLWILVIKRPVHRPFWNFLPIGISLSLLKCCFCDFMLNWTKENAILLRLQERRLNEWKNNNRVKNKELEFLLVGSWSQQSNVCHVRRKSRKSGNNL